MTSDRVPLRRWVGRLFLLACLAAVLAVAWAAVSLVGLSSMDDICGWRAPAGAGSTQSAELWPPSVTCRYLTDRGVVITTREDGEARMRVAGVAIAGVLAIGAWALVARRVLPRRVDRTQDLAAGPRP